MSNMSDNDKVNVICEEALAEVTECALVRFVAAWRAEAYE